MSSTTRSLKTVRICPNILKENLIYFLFALHISFPGIIEKGIKTSRIFCCCYIFYEIILGKDKYATLIIVWLDDCVIFRVSLLYINSIQ